MREAGSLWKPEEGVVSPGAGDLGGCEQPSVGSGNQTQVLGRDSKCSSLLRHLSGAQWVSHLSVYDDVSVTLK